MPAPRMAITIDVEHPLNHRHHVVRELRSRQLANKPSYAILWHQGCQSRGPCCPVIREKYGEPRSSIFVYHDLKPTIRGVLRTDHPNLMYTESCHPTGNASNTMLVTAKNTPYKSHYHIMNKQHSSHIKRPILQQQMSKAKAGLWTARKELDKAI